MSIYLVTDESNAEWNALVEMTEAEADRVVENGYAVDPIDPKRAMSFAAFCDEYLDPDA